MRLQLNFVLNVLKQISILTFATDVVCFKMLDNKMGVEEDANLLDNQKKNAWIRKIILFCHVMYTMLPISIQIIACKLYILLPTMCDRKIDAKLLGKW